MPPRPQPTARQERLGAELRKMREAAGITAREAAALLGTNPMQMSHMETGRAGISGRRLRSLASQCACSDTDYVDALVGIATDRTQGWWEDYRGVLPSSFLDLAELEHHARFLRSLDVVHIPGLMQVEEYAEALFTYTVPDLPASDLESWVDHRMRRRTVLEREDTPPYEAVIHEAALRMKVCDRRTNQKQLSQILELSDSGRIIVRVIPFSADHFAGAGCSMLHAGGPVPKLDTVQRDTPHGSGHVDAEPQLDRLRLLYQKARRASLTPHRSRDLIRHVTHEI
ncbi:helix-turn-helix domain-containing protein [Streptomyces oceani]|uniref:DNA-binding protein n=1 Tax=Streptomyces oceani TaxID=1075402 RepID=A0A1E7JJ41_9ACTN|nr:helix-turn-helix transcriptional regulator [Streptomyces oceani]OEU86476.1 DNA-binding protein [Streptomyces oceani]